VAASNGEPPVQEKEQVTTELKRRKVEELASSLKKMGIDRSTAQRIMGIWRKSGAADPDGLRKLFLKRSVNKSTQIALQLLVDAAAGAGAFYAARSISSDQLGTWTLAAKYGERQGRGAAAHWTTRWRPTLPRCAALEPANTFLVRHPPHLFSPPPCRLLLPGHVPLHLRFF
jgi:hypothetical protein